MIIDIKRIRNKMILGIGILIVLFLPNYSLGSFKAKSYNFTDDEIRRIASMCYSENGSSTDAMRAEASLMANLYEKKGDGKYTTSGFIKYITTGGWFASSSVEDYYYPYNLSSSYINAVKDVLVNGNRYFPVYVDEHDWLGDITSVSNNGVSFDPYDRSKYKKGVTKIRNCYGAVYTFYCFPDEESDPFGYISMSTNSGVLSSIKVSKMPTKTTYTVGDKLNTKGLTLIAKYSNYTEQQITTGFSCTPTTLNTAGTQTITVSYGGKKTTFKVKVNKKTINMSGVKFENKTVKYNGKAQNIKITGTLPTGVSVKYEGNGKINAGKYTVTAKFVVDTTKYNAIPNKTAILTIQKINPKVTPNYDKDKKIYIGDQLPQLSLTQGDTKGTIKWDEYTLDVGTKEYGWTFIPTDKTNYNTKKGKEIFNVLEVELDSIKITNQPQKVKYIEGENFNKAGMKVFAVYKNGSSKEITNFTVKNGERLEAGQTRVIISYKEKDIVKEQVQKITVEENLKITVDEEFPYEIIQEEEAKYIDKIDSGTTMEILLGKIKTNGEIKVYKGRTEITNKQTKIGTGMIIKVSKGGEEKEYTAVVKGDTTGDGKVNATDLISAVKQYKYVITKGQKGAKLEGVKLKAIKFTEGEEYTPADLIGEVKLFKKYISK